VKFVSFYLELPIFLVMIVGWKLLKKTKFRKAHEMDLETDVYTKENMEPIQTGVERDEYEDRGSASEAQECNREILRSDAVPTSAMSCCRYPNARLERTFYALLSISLRLKTTKFSPS
jgi:hypothetical protein